jgi:hypothetical protein
MREDRDPAGPRSFLCLRKSRFRASAFATTAFLGVRRVLAFDGEILLRQPYILLYASVSKLGALATGCCVPVIHVPADVPWLLYSFATGREDCSKIGFTSEQTLQRCALVLIPSAGPGYPATSDLLSKPSPFLSVL